MCEHFEHYESLYTLKTTYNKKWARDCPYYDGEVSPRYYLDLFAGIGGFALGARWAGLRFDGHYFSEVDDYAVKVYRKNFKRAIPLGDCRNINYKKLPKGEWFVSGGFPCQPHSITGKRRGAADQRDLWAECNRMLRELRPRYALFENVPAVLISNGGRYFNRILSDFSESGYDVEWQTLRASDFGAPHKRERLWIIAYSQSERWTKTKQGLTYFSKSCKEKPIEWEQLQSISTRAYTIQHRENYENYFCRDDDGLPSKMDRARVKALGNAVVPQVAAYLWGLIKERAEDEAT
jgi:DNA (cytosine-5)-methyltransferase 1